MKRITAFFMAWGNFFFVPCPCRVWDDIQRRGMVKFLPAIGLFIGLIWAGAFLIFTSDWGRILVPAPLSAAILTVLPFFLSGFIHLDGYMDCCDAVSSNLPREEKLRILKDSHVGAFAVVKTIILFLLVFAAFMSIMGLDGANSAVEMLTVIASLILMPVISRAASARGILKLPVMAHSQYNTGEGEENLKAGGVGTAKRETEGAAGDFEKYSAEKINISLLTFVIELTIIFSIIFLIVVTVVEIIEDLQVYNSTFESGATGTALRAGIVYIGVIITHLVATRRMVKNLGGMSGDVAGFGITVSEAVGLVVLAVVV